MESDPILVALVAPKNERSYISTFRVTKSLCYFHCWLDLVHYAAGCAPSIDLCAQMRHLIREITIDVVSMCILSA